MDTKDINDAIKPLRENWEAIRQDYARNVPGKYLVLTCVHRPVKDQLALFKKGRKLDSNGVWQVANKAAIVTNVDGYKVLGAHNYKPSRAIDVAVVDNQTGRVVWEEECYLPLVQIAARYGLESGGSWKSIKDWPHIQVRDYKNYKEVAA